MSYVARLKDAIRRVENGEIAQGLRLSDEIHEFEENGGELTEYEDELLENLTAELEKAETLSPE